MLKSQNAVGENTRALKQSGMSEKEAVSLAVRRQSLGEREEAVREAVRKKFAPPPEKKSKGNGCCDIGPCGSSPHPWVQSDNIYDTYCVFEQGGKHFKVSLTWSGKTVTVGDKQEVRRSWEPV